jgi:excinuclease ABC subunit C
LRTRLLSYFRGDRGDKATEILSAATRIEWEYQPSEFASLLRELNLIRQHRPWFNVQHKLERSVCFIRITTDPAPCLQLATRAANDGSLYYGPYRGRELVRGLLRELSDVLQLRDCAPATPLRFADQIDLFDFEPVPRCVRADLGKCLAPCAARCTRAGYAARVAEARRFIEGARDRPIQLLNQRMQQAAERMQFEYAATLRDRVLRLEGARAELVELRRSIEALTFVYLVPGHRAEDRVYVIRRGVVLLDRPAPRCAEEESSLWESATDVFRRRESAVAVDPAKVSEMLLLDRWFRLRPDELTRTITPERIGH